MTFFKSIEKIFIKQRKKNKINEVSIKEILTKGAYLLMLIALFIYSFEDSSIYANLVYVSSNLESLNIFPQEIDIVKNIYPVFNEKNYIFTEEENNEKIEEAIVVEEKPLIIDNVDYGNIDNIDKYAAKNYLNEMENMPVAISQGPGYEYIQISDFIEIRDFSDLPNIPYSEIMKGNITLTKSNDKIFIYDTHASETYTSSDMFNINYTGNYRSTDENYNMISVANRLSNFLEEKNINVIEDRNGHDYGSYTMSYASSRSFCS